jgi:hypothetical protein
MIKEHENPTGTSTLARTISVITLVFGFVGVVWAATFLVVGLSLPIEGDSIWHDFIAAIFWFCAGPLLILAGVNVWKMSKAAAWLAMEIFFFNLVLSALLQYTLAWIIDIIVLVPVAITWKKLPG